MALQAAVTWDSRNNPPFLSMMESAADKEERKREYNRLAQREFRRRRKEHLKSLEKAQKEQNSEQSEEIERLRFDNAELRRENESLKAQIYGSSSAQSLSSTSMNVPQPSTDAGIYSPSPSISGTSISGTSSPPDSMIQNMMPLATLSATSSMLPLTMQTYADSTSLSNQPYSMVHPSIRRHNSQSSPDLSGFQSSSSSAMGSQFQSLNISQPPTEVQAPHPGSIPRRSSAQARLMIMTPYDNNKARAELHSIFQPLFTDPSILTDPQRHISVLRSMSDTLPQSLRPTPAQLAAPHYYGIDMVASPVLRERLMTLTVDVAQRFVAEIGITVQEREDAGNLMIWGEALNEMSWEFSQAILQRWGWLLGSEWVVRANFWRRQRGAPLLADW